MCAHFLRRPRREAHGAQTWQGAHPIRRERRAPDCAAVSNYAALSLRDPPPPVCYPVPPIAEWREHRPRERAAARALPATIRQPTDTAVDSCNKLTPNPLLFQVILDT